MVVGAGCGCSTYSVYSLGPELCLVFVVNRDVCILILSCCKYILSQGKGKKK